MSSFNTPDFNINYGNIKIKIFGFICSLFLTIFSFGIVNKQIFSNNTLIYIISSIAIIQILIHLICFLNISIYLNNHLNIISLIFTMFIICILVTGSLWIMYNLNINMALD